MAKQLSNLNKRVDRTTFDLFETDKRPGRPKTNPYSRELQLKHNKRNQLKRDKATGLQRIEFKVSGTIYDALNEQARQQSISRSELIESLLNSAVSTAQV